jgi:hypothetical protein
MPAGILEPGDMPRVFKAVVEHEDLTQEFTHTPEIVFSLVGTE